MTSTLAQALFDGIAIGAVYGLIALGLSLQFGVMKIINFAHGSLLMIAMYVALWSCQRWSLPPLAAIPLVAAVLYVLGLGIERWLIDPVYRKEATREPMGVLIFTAGLGIFLENFMLTIAGPDQKSLAGDWVNQTVRVGGLLFTYPQIAGFVVSALVTLLLALFLKKTRTGRAIRATGQDREAASVLGVDTAKVHRLAFAVGLGVLGVAGSVLLPMNAVDPFLGGVFGMRAFIIVVLGGIGSIAGAFWGGILVGVVESVGSQFIPVTFAQGLIFMIFLVVLYVRPSGLFGLEEA